MKKEQALNQKSPFSREFLDGKYHLEEFYEAKTSKYVGIEEIKDIEK